MTFVLNICFFFFQAEDGIRDWSVTGIQTCALPIYHLIAFLNHRSAPVKVVVWAHNSHVGDARATSMRARGELNIGQLARERYGDDALLIGFSTNAGHVTAASEWGGPTERKRVR